MRSRSDPDRAARRSNAVDQGADRVLGDIGGEQDEADRHELLGTALRGPGDAALSGEAPDHDDRGAERTIFYDKGLRLTRDRPRKPNSLDARHDLLQSSLVPIDTLLVQHVLADPEWAEQLTDADLRGLTPLFWSNINPYGTFRLEMTHTLGLGIAVSPEDGVLA